MNNLFKRIQKLVNSDNNEPRMLLHDLVIKYSDEIKDHFNDELSEHINNCMDADLIYYSDQWEALQRFTNPMDLLNGKYTMDDFWDDLYNEYMSDDNTLYDFLDDLCDDELQEFIDTLED